MTIRPSEIRDIPDLMKIYDSARNYMRSKGNTVQWVNGYPSEDLVSSDIENGYGYVIEEQGKICGCFAFIIGEDPTYLKIEDGEWLCPGKAYGTIHRIGSSGSVPGILEEALKFCSSKIDNIRIDTHEMNHVMQNLMDKNGFTRCGIIYISDGTPRIAYQKLY